MVIYFVLSRYRIIIIFQKNNFRVSEHALSCQQTTKLLSTFFGLGDIKVQAAVVAYPQIQDKDQFSSLLLEAFKFEEERVDVRKRLGL